jgi:hypothetical protein
MRIGWDERGIALLLRLAAARFAGNERAEGEPSTMINIVMGEKLGATNRAQFFLTVTASGRTSYSAIDRRLQHYPDPRLDLARFKSLPTLRIDAKAGRTDSDCIVEVLLPWRNLGIQPRPGAELSLQVMVFGRPVMMWYPVGWASQNPWAMYPIRLAPKPSPLMAEPGAPGLWMRHPARRPKGFFVGSNGYQLYLPPGAERIRGVYVTLAGKRHMTPVMETGFGSYTPMRHVRPKREFVERHQFALMGRSGSGGSSQTVLAALKEFAGMTGHPELEHAPIIVDGYSMGSIATWQILHDMPERIIAFAALEYLAMKPDMPDAAFDVPGILYSGRAITNEKNGLYRALCTGRARSAPWAAIGQPKVGHSCGSVESLLFAYYNDLIPRRLPPKSVLDRPAKLRAVRLEDGYVARHFTHEIVPAAEYSRDPGRASWMPTRFTAHLWRLLNTTERSGVTVPAVQEILRELD